MVIQQPIPSDTSDTPAFVWCFPFCEMPHESWGLNLMISDFAWEYGIPQPSNFPRFKASSMEKNMAGRGNDETMKWCPWRTRWILILGELWLYFTNLQLPESTAHFARKSLASLPLGGFWGQCLKWIHLPNGRFQCHFANKKIANTEDVK